MHIVIRTKKLSKVWKDFLASTDMADVASEPLLMEIVNETLFEDLVSSVFKAPESNERILMSCGKEIDVNRLVEGKCYKLPDIAVKVFDGKKFLSLSQEATATEISDIGQVGMVTSDAGECTGHQVVRGTVIGVQSMKEYRSCILCIEATLPN